MRAYSVRGHVALNPRGPKWMQSLTWFNQLLSPSAPEDASVRIRSCPTPPFCGSHGQGLHAPALSSIAYAKGMCRAKVVLYFADKPECGPALYSLKRYVRPTQEQPFISLKNTNPAEINNEGMSLTTPYNSKQRFALRRRKMHRFESDRAQPLFFAFCHRRWQTCCYSSKGVAAMLWLEEMLPCDRICYEGATWPWARGATQSSVSSVGQDILKAPKRHEDRVMSYR